MTEPEELLLSDAERLHALTVLGEHYASGRLDDPEFHSRSAEVAAARTLGGITGSFHDLPGGVPLQSVDGLIVRSSSSAGGELVPGSSSSPATTTPHETSRELHQLRSRGRIVESVNGIAFGVTLMTFLVLQFIVGWQFAWIVWPSLVLTLALVRVGLRFGDSDEKLYAKLKKADDKAREERLRAATTRIRELDGRETREG